MIYAGANHSVVQWLQEQFLAIDPDEVYLMQYCGSHLDHDLTHLFAIEALQRAGLSPELYETENHSHYLVTQGTMPSCDLYPDEALQWRIDFEVLIPKSTPEIQVQLTEDVLDEMLVASLGYFEHPVLAWMEDLFNCWGQERNRAMYNALARYRELPPEQDLAVCPYDPEDSPNPDKYYYYEGQFPGFLWDDFRNIVLAVRSHHGANAAVIPFHDFDDYSGSAEVQRGDSYSCNVMVYNHGDEADSYTFEVAEGEARTALAGATIPALDDAAPGSLTPVPLDLANVGGGGEDELRIWIKVTSTRATEHGEPIDFIEARLHIDVID